MASFTHLLIAAEGTGKPINHYNTATLSNTISNPNQDTGSAADLFGYNVSLKGTKMVVGAPHEDAGAVTNTGKVYYYNNNTSPTYVFTNPNNPATGTDDFFGWDCDVSNGYVVVGAHGDDQPETDSGKVYLYDIQANFTPTVPVHTWTNPNDFNSAPNTDKFGYSVAINDKFVVAGAPYEDSSGVTDGGRAFVFDIATKNLLQTLTQPSPGTNEHFGWAVDIDEGGTVVVGAKGRTNDAGEAYVYAATSGTLLHTLPNPNFDPGQTDDNFGTSVSISGRYIAVGAPREDDANTLQINVGMVYVYDLQSVTPTTPILQIRNPDNTATNGADYFGESVSMDGVHLVVGARGVDTDTGEAYLYDVTTTPDGNGHIAPLATITNPNATTGDSFARSVAVSGDLVVIGNEVANTAYTYDLTTV